MGVRQPRGRRERRERRLQPAAEAIDQHGARAAPDGVIIDWFIYTAFGGSGSDGVDWVRRIVAIVVAAVLVVIASTVTGRHRSKNPLKS